jgi:ketosteroid isomerase-like protein
MDAEKTFKAFVAAIDQHDVETVAGLMAADHVFVDSLGKRVTGADSMKAGWRGYFAMCPDYWIRIDNLLAKDDLVLAAGEAGGTIGGAAWRTPAAWKAMIHDGKVAEWHVFADNKPVYEILARPKA